MRALAAVVVMFLLLCWFIGRPRVPPAQTPRNPPAGASAPAGSTEDLSVPSETFEFKNERWAFIQDLLSKGIFLKVEMPRDVPYVWVGPRFYSLSFEQKKDFLGVVCAHYIQENPKITIMRIRDNLSGKDVGRFDRSDGHLTME